MEEEGEVEAEILQIDIQTVGDSRHRIVNPVLVSLRNLAIAVQVFPHDASQACTRLLGVVVNIVLRAEDTFSHISYLRPHRVSHYRLHTIATESAVGCHRLRQFGNHIVVVRKVHIHIPAEAVGLAFAAQHQFLADVAHATCIHPLACALTHSGYACHVEQNIIRILVEPIETTVQLLPPEREVDTRIGLRGSLPTEVVVAYLRALHTRGQRTTAIGARDIIPRTVTLSAALVHAVAAHIDIVARQVGNLLVTRLSPRDTNLQVIKHRACGLHPLLFAQTPSERNGRESGKLVVTTKTAGTIATHRERRHIAIVVGVVGFCEIGQQRVALRRTIGLRLACTRIWPHIVGREQNIVLFVAREILRLLAVQLHTHHHIAAVLLHIEVIGRYGIPHPAHPVLLLCLHGIGRGRYIAFRNRIGEDTLLLLRVVETRRCADMQPFVCLHIHKRISEQAPVGVAVVGIAFDTRHRVLPIRITAHRTRILAIFGIDGQRGIELQGILQDAAGRLYLRGARQREVLTNLYFIVQERVIGIGTRREAVEVRAFDNAHVLIIVHREETAPVLTALAHREVVLLHDTRARDLVEPVGVGGRGCARFV